MAPSRLRLWLRVIGTAFLAWILLLAIAGFTYQSTSIARDRRAYPMPGQLVDVGGYRMHIYCTGQQSPTVVLDSSLGDPFDVWHKVQPQISQFARVCSYDRAGLGYSDSGPHPPLSKNIAEELHTLLHNSGIAGPYILVGHSMGGYDIRLFAGLYRDEVGGMVFVDSSHPDQNKRFPTIPSEKAEEASADRKAKLEQFAMLFGLPRLFEFFDPFDYCHGDAEMRATQCNFHSVRTGVAAMKTFDESAAQAAATGPFGDLPIAALSHDPENSGWGGDLTAAQIKSLEDAWVQMQEELAHLSTRGARTVAKNSSHYIQLDRPDVVIDAIRSVVDQARQTPQVAQTKL
jgi:pimeloyl-ACP methyl ester carboxylesterase